MQEPSLTKEKETKAVSCKLTIQNNNTSVTKDYGRKFYETTPGSRSPQLYLISNLSRQSNNTYITK